MKQVFSGKEYILRKNDKLENFLIDLRKRKNEKILTCHLMYRPPWVKILENWQMFEGLNDKISNKNDDILICVDFSINISKSRLKQKNYQEIINMYDLQVNSFEPTGVTSTSSACIDHFTSSCFNDAKILQCKISDRYALLNLLHTSINKKLDYITQGNTGAINRSAPFQSIEMSKTVGLLKIAKNRDMRKINVS